MNSPGGPSGADRLTVVTAANDSFMLPLAALISSIAAVHRRQDVQVVVLTDSIRAEDRQRLGDLYPLNWINVGDVVEPRVRMPERLGEAAAWRLTIDRLIPDAQRVIYLDADTLVRRNLAELGSVDLGGAAVGAVTDAYVPWFGAPTGPPWESLGVAPTTPYFNSGVMVMDLALWRARSIGSEAFRLLRDFSLPYGDQCAINAVLDGAWMRVAPTWNIQTAHLTADSHFGWVVEPEDEFNAALGEPAIVHFTHLSPGRPWLGHVSHPFGQEWFAALDRTAWSGWRPETQGPPPSRLRRAAYILRHG